MPPDPTTTLPRPAFWRTVWRSLRLRCPRCGRSRIFAGYFQMHPKCDACQLPFERDAGYYLGSIYVNYGITAVLIVAGYFAMFLGTELSDRSRLAILAACCVLFPLWFFRYARSLWRGMDYYFDPQADAPRITSQQDRQ